MSYILKRKIANKSNYGNARSLSKIKYIVIHYTSNDGDTDEANANYFKNNIVRASAHYFVDSNSVTQSVPDNYVAWSVGGSKYADCKRTGGGSFYGKCNNTNSISIELCDDVKNGKVYPSAKTIENAVELTKVLMKKYNVPSSRVIRHFDVVGKKCPAYWCGSVAKNEKWSTEFHDKLDASTNRLVKITANSLNIRAGAGVKYDVVGKVKKNEVFTIVSTKGSWGKLKSGRGWINLKYTKNFN